MSRIVFAAAICLGLATLAPNAVADDDPADWFTWQTERSAVPELFGVPDLDRSPLIPLLTPQCVSLELVGFERCRFDIGEIVHAAKKKSVKRSRGQYNPSLKAMVGPMDKWSKITTGLVAGGLVAGGHAR